MVNWKVVGEWFYQDFWEWDQTENTILSPSSTFYARQIVIKSLRKKEIIIGHKLAMQATVHGWGGAEE